MSNGVDLTSIAQQVITSLVQVANREISQYRAHGTEEAKGLNDLVTEADRRIELQMTSILTTLLEGSRARGEEGVAASADPHGEYEWVLDPIDGTVNFARDCEFYTSVVALLQSNIPQIAIAYQHDMSSITYAVRGKGCYKLSLDERATIKSTLRLRVRPKPFEQTLYSLMISPKLSKSARKASFKFAEKTLDLALGFRVLISQAYEATKLAEGGINGVVSFQSSGGWTRDASRLICEEAGGVYTTIINTASTGEKGFMLVDDPNLVESLRPLLQSVGYTMGYISSTGA